MDFYGRAAALHELVAHTSAAHDTGGGRLLLVTGRRQVGKSRLLTEFVERSRLPYLYYTAPQTPAHTDHMAAWVAGSAHATAPLRDAPALFETPPRDWPDVFGRLATVCRATPGIVVIDDVAAAIAAEPNLVEILAAAWKRQLRRCPLLLVLVGGSAEAGALTGALPGMATMTLAPFNPAECAHALGAQTTPMNAFDAYLVTGGYPRLVAGCARAVTAAAEVAAGPARRASDAGAPAGLHDFVRSELRDENSDFVVMGQRRLATELAESASAQAVLAGIGREDVELTSFSRIVARHPARGITAQTAATRALKLLAERKALVAAEVPVGAPANTKLRRYHLDDLYLRFWCRFVLPHIDDIARGRPDIAVAEFDAHWPAWRTVAVGPVARTCLRRLALSRPEFTRVETVGAWWSRDGSHEYDVVMGGDATHPIVAVGAVKWREGEPFTPAEARQLASARAVVPGAERTRLLAVCPAGADPEADVDVVLDAEALLSAW